MHVKRSAVSTVSKKASRQIRGGPNINQWIGGRRTKVRSGEDINTSINISIAKADQ